MNYQYHLQPYSGKPSRYRCPACNQPRKTFTRYIDADTGQAIAPHVGLCDRVDSCGYHFTPKQFFEQAGRIQLSVQRRPPARRKPQPQLFINPYYVNESFANYHANHFVQYLITRFGHNLADRLVGMYRIGTSGYWPGATIFWQLDAGGNVRSGKIMLYNPTTGKRVKQPFSHITWAHTVLARQHSATEAFTLKQCLFGEHLLPTSVYKPVAIVESEKTAIIAAAMMPAFFWLACGSLNGLNADKCKALQGRQVMLFPDVNGYQLWQQKATELRRAMPGTRIEVSNLLERRATDADRKNGADIADVVFR
ncbi:DUF6371 domain-containing protein [Mucilaginibacter sp. AK015]|uniref:DUF6371 domain-containing protein n=1 Tax=Mucilaginibacter sp. AK015 TaxID=2723072 RepID=UPI00160D5896|nr:DUF6371 domain-containing protein [Mucilaginibacter sp. AK015]MBB5396550.1 hypothetical protein [Mucilaginibacter sp. AK015]